MDGSLLHYLVTLPYNTHILTIHTPPRSALDYEHHADSGRCASRGLDQTESVQHFRGRVSGTRAGPAGSDETYLFYPGQFDRQVRETQRHYLVALLEALLSPLFALAK